MDSPLARSVDELAVALGESDSQVRFLHLDKEVDTRCFELVSLEVELVQYSSVLVHR